MILQETRNFYFHPILMGFFVFDSSHWEFSVVCQQIFSIFYRFKVIRGQSSGGRGIQFRLMWKNLIFLIRMVFFFEWFLMKKLTNWHLLRIIWVKMIFHPVISLCPAFFCVQHLTVSSTFLCPTKYCVHTYPKGLLFTCHISTCGVSCCACEAPLFIFLLIFNIVSWWVIYSSQKLWNLFCLR